MKSWANLIKSIWAIVSVTLSLLDDLPTPVIPSSFVVVGIIVWAVLSGHYAHAVVFYVLYVGMLMLFLLRLRTTDRGIVHYSHQYRLRPSPVVFTVFAPRHIARGHSFILSLWVHFPEQIDTVLKLAQLLQPSEAVGLRAGVPIELGTDIVFSLHLPTLNVDYGLDKVTWTGQPSNASFRVRVPTYTTSDLHDGHIDVYTGCIRIARVLFSVALSSEEPSTSQERLRSRIERLQTAFASYASADLVDVLGRIQGMKKIAPDLDVFLDALSLRSGDLWESRLAEEVISREIFYLFWSRNAAKSTWVGREWQHALANRGIGYIDPVPLETPEVAPPPDALASLHFGDAFASFAFLQRGVDRDKTDS